MPSLSETITIARPREEVWDYVRDVGNTPRWNPMFVHQELVGASEVTPGATIRSVAKVLGRRIEGDSEVIAIDAPHRSTLASSSPVRMVGNYLLEEVPGGTLFVWHLDAEAGLGGLFGLLTDGIVLSVARRQIRRALRNLKRTLEVTTATTVSSH